MNDVWAQNTLITYKYSLAADKLKRLQNPKLQTKFHWSPIRPRILSRRKKKVMSRKKRNRTKQKIEARKRKEIQLYTFEFVHFKTGQISSHRMWSKSFCEIFHRLKWLEFWIVTRWLNYFSDLAIYNYDNLPNSLCIKIGSEFCHILNKPSKTAKGCRDFTKEAYFRQIWSHCSGRHIRHQSVETGKNTFGLVIIVIIKESWMAVLETPIVVKCRCYKTFLEIFQN